MKRVIFLLACISIKSALACSSVSYQDPRGGSWVIKSFDYASGAGKLFLNQKNVSKRSLTLTLGLGKSWVSKFGSITFNQIARDFPFGGMNEAGLNMEILWLSQTKYPALKKKTRQINESQLIQYVLDTAGTVKEAIQKIRAVQMAPIMAPVHYSLCDAGNRCAVVEYLEGRLVVTEMGKEKERILQNSIYGEDLAQRLRVDETTARASAREVRFIFTNPALDEDHFVRKSFENLEVLRQGDWSKWQIVYDLKDRKAWFRTVQSPHIKSIRLADHELDCAKAGSAKVIDLNSALEGDVTDELLDFSEKTNSSLLEGFDGVPSWMKKVAHAYLYLNHTCIKDKTSQRPMK